MKAALLPDRGIVKVAGAAARTFLNGLLTADIDKASADRTVFAALLTPQGKILVDFIVVEHATDEPAAADAGGFLLDCPQDLAAMLVQKLAFYRLRSKVTIDDLSATHGVLALWDASRAPPKPACPDPRLAALGYRAIVARASATTTAAELGAGLVDASEYEAHRIALGIPRGGIDFPYGDTFPHEADMDQLAGVDFTKGCYVGQEVVSRMQHRGTARTRIVMVAYAGPAPASGTPIVAGDKTIGRLGSTTADRGLAFVRLDRLADALGTGTPLTAAGVPLTAVKPDWARFEWPGPLPVSTG
jgi:tRNA-modifying protein YgfZ